MKAANCILKHLVSLYKVHAIILVMAQQFHAIVRMEDTLLLQVMAPHVGSDDIDSSAYK